MTTIVLTKPVAIGPQMFSELTFREVKFGDMPSVIRAASLVDLDDLVHLVARLADVPLEAACNIDPDDIAPVLDALTSHITKTVTKR